MYKNDTDMNAKLCTQMLTNCQSYNRTHLNNQPDKEQKPKTRLLMPKMKEARVLLRQKKEAGQLLRRLWTLPSSRYFSKLSAKTPTK